MRAHARPREKSVPADPVKTERQEPGAATLTSRKARLDPRLNMARPLETA